MSEIYIKYSALEEAIEYSSKAREKIDVYMMEIGKVINTPAGNLPGTDECGYVQSAVNLAPDCSKAIENLTGIGKTSKVFSIFDKYATKTGKAIVGLLEVTESLCAEE